MLTTLLNPKHRTSSYHKFGRDFLAFAFLPLLLCSLAPAAALSSQTPNKTTNPKIPADLMPILENTLYSIKSDTSGVRRAENAANRFSVEFSGAQTIVHTSTAETAPATLRVDGYGWGSTLNPAGAVTQVQTAGKRLDRHYASGFSEWFENTRQGLEQGFVLEQRATVATGALHIRLAAEDGWSVKAAGDAVQLTRGTTTLHYAGLKAWDANHAALPARLRAVGSAIEIEVDDAHAVYPLTVDPTLYVQVAELTPYDAAAGEYLGVSVALSADGTTALVGAYSKASGKGYAYIFADNNGNWGQSKELTSSNTSDGFGLSVALSGDGTIALIGATDSATTPAAYVFTHSSVYTWTQQNITDPSFPPNAVSSPVNVALSGDGSTALIGVPLASGGYVIAYTSSSGTFTQQGPSLYPVSGGTPISYGSALALSNNGNTALIGCAGYILNGLPARGGYPTGAGFLFTRTGTSWAQTGLLTASDGYKLGSAVALSGDGTTAVMTGQGSPSAAYVYTIPSASGTPVELLPSGGDGIGNISLSSDGNTLIGGSTALGSAYVFTRSGTTWTQAETLTASDEVSTDYFGYSVAVSGDAGTLLVGAFGKNSSAGTAYVFRLSSALISQTITFPTVPNQIQGTNLPVNVGSGLATASSGLPVSLTSNTPNVCVMKTGIAIVNVLNFVAVGTCSLTASQPGNGIYIAAAPVTQTFTVVPQVDITPTPYSQQAEVAASDAASGLDFGASVALSANGNTALVGAYNQTSGKGYAYIFTRTSGTWTQSAELTSPNTFDNFGASVALSADGTVALVGAVDSDTSPAAYVFTYSGGTWFRQPVNNINVNGFLPGRPYSFPTFVALSGDGTTALIGEPSAHWNCGDGCGQFFVYTVSGPPKASLRLLYSAWPIHLGASVALSYNGNTVLVGAPNYETGILFPNGVVFVYTYSGNTWAQTLLTGADVPADGEANDSFGTAVALSSDGTTAVVSGGNGVAYVFKYSGTTWTPQADLLPSDGGGIGNISLSSDGNTFVGSDTVTGSAYLFTRSGTTWSAGKLIASDEVSTDLFGNSVAISGDASTLLIGAYGKNSSAGAAYFFGLPTTLTAQTITFNTIPTQTEGTPLTLTATASSNLAVTYVSNSNSVCTVNGTVASFVGTGSCSITALQAGNSTYAAATPVTQTFNVVAPGTTGGSNPGITSQTPGAVRNNYTGYVGMEFAVGSTPLTVNSLGRFIAPGNSQVHLVKLVQANGTDVPAGSVSINTATGTSGTYEYAALASPITLLANTSYFLVSMETAGGDSWYDFGPVTASSSITVLAPTYTDGGGHYVPVSNLAGESYVPLNFLTGTATTPAGLSVNITSPVSAATISGVTPVTVATTGAVTSLQIQVDGANVGSPVAASGSSDTLSLNTAQLTNGAHTLVVVASDAASDKVSSAGVSVTVANTSGSSTSFVTTEKPGPARNNYSGFVGMNFTVGSSPVVVTSLGRFVISGNTGTHVVKLVQANGTNVPGGSVTVATAGVTRGTFAYGTLTTPVTLQAGTSYYLVSQEAANGDQWYDIGAVTTTSVASVTGPVYADGNGNYVTVGGLAGNSYVPVSFTYGGSGTTPPAISATITSPSTGALISGASVPVAVSTTGPVTSLQVQVDGNNVGSPVSASPLTLNTTALTNGQHTLTVVASDASNDTAPSPGVTVTVNNGGVAPTAFITGERSQSTLRNNYTGGVGMAINIGDKSLSVSSLGRLMSLGNTGTHVLTLVQANGTPVPGGSATVNMAGGTVGQFVYAALTTPVTLAANTVYYVVSQEVSGGDKWYDLEPIITTTAAIVTGPTYTDGHGNNVIVAGYPGYSYVPLSFLYQ